MGATTELIVGELLYLQYRQRAKPIFIYINSTGCTRANGEATGFETEGTAIYDTMKYLDSEINTVGVGLAFGHACMLLAAGQKGKRSMLLHSTAMLHQPRLSPTGRRQAVEIEKKWREMADQKNAYMRILSESTGQTKNKIWVDLQRPLYMQPETALEYGIIDKIVKSPCKAD